ncbi:hypothetical protein [uncultured Prevotella sp.]|uniref:hypothetical protein n=1 Tax=uncultured Prevotella sp. TaxID=159272 RepID=UPI002584F2CD|nr:hypothetical protein [uncultured Prevotella sp.]
MKRLFFMPLLAAMIAVHAQDIKEGEMLHEVTVKGSKVVQRVDGQTIYPTRQQLESSPNGYSLLSKLTLPHLRIDPVMHTVTALSNLGSVQVRINDIVASKEDLLSLDMKAIQQIDYIDNPGVRYGEGIAYVINIIVKRPVSGYDIGADLTNTLTAVNGDETVYGKFNYGKSEFGVNYSLDYRNFKGSEYEETATYELESGTAYNVLRQQLEGQNKNLDQKIQLTYSLSDSNYVFQSKLSARRDIQPNRLFSRFEGYEDLSSSRTSSPVLDLYFHHDFGAHQSLTANAVGTYIKTDSHAEHNEGGSYAYDVTGKTYSLWTEAVYENRLKPFTLSLGTQYGQKYINNAYSGDADASNAMRSSMLYFFGQLKGRLGKLAYMGGLGVSSRYYRQGQWNDRFLLFRPKMTLAYPLARSLKIKYDFEVSQHVSQIALVSDVSIKQNAMETLVGNPEITPNRVTSHDLRLTYSTSRIMSELQGYWRLNANCNMEKYYRTDGHFYQTQTNADNECSFFYIQSYNRWEAIPEHLSLTLYGGIYRFFNFTDTYRHTYTAFNGGASAEAYLGKWTLTAYADNGWNFMEGEHRGHQAAAWYLTASYQLKNITLSLYAQHPLCSNPLSHQTEVLSRYIHKEVSQHSRDLGNMLTFNLTWHLSSGRKYRDIQRTMNHRDTETGILQGK